MSFVLFRFRSPAKNALLKDTVSEWLRRWTRNPLVGAGSSRAAVCAALSARRRGVVGAQKKKRGEAEEKAGETTAGKRNRGWQRFELEGAKISLLESRRPAWATR